MRVCNCFLLLESKAVIDKKASPETHRALHSAAAYNTVYAVGMLAGSGTPEMFDRRGNVHFGNAAYGVFRLISRSR